MHFFKKMLGLKEDLTQRVAAFKARGSLFEVEIDTRDVILREATITFVQEGDNRYVIDFRGDKDEVYQLPIHLSMNAVTFSFNKGGKAMAGFEWQLQDQPKHVGFYADAEHKPEFREILCLILKAMANDEHIKDHLVFCKQLPGIPVYKSEQKASKAASSGMGGQAKEELNNRLIQQAQKQENLMVHSCSMYFIVSRERKLIHQGAIFVFKSFPDFRYEFQVINSEGFVVMKKVFDGNLNYEVNAEGGYIRWIDINNDCRIVQVNFDGKRDAALSLKYNLMEVMYELRERKKINEIVDKDEIAYMKKINAMPLPEVAKSKVVELYKNNKKGGFIQSVDTNSIVYGDEEFNGKGYHDLCQAKIANFELAALGSMMETLNIGEDSRIKQTYKKRLFDKQGRQVQIGGIHLHDLDSKGLIRGKDGRIYYQDLGKGKLIQQYDPSPKNRIIEICPEFKLADAGEFKTFKAISDNAVFQIDPRIKEGVGMQKNYTTNPHFSCLSVNGNGGFATGSAEGEVRFYKSIGKNANNKFTSEGGPVLHLDTTKDGKWVLATFKRYLRLIPTLTEDDQSLFDRKVAFEDRPTPIKLDIRLDDLQRLKVRDFTFVPAKFDESREEMQRFIVSGFGEYTVIWNMGQVMRGDRTYILSKNVGQVVQADFRWNDPTKLLMSTSSGIVVRENKLRN